MRSALLVLTIIALMGCGGLPRSPRGAYDDYMSAYGKGDADRLWTLSSAGVHSDAERFKSDLLKILSNSDAAVRIPVEGAYGITREEVEPMERKAFFVWWMGAMRKRLGGRFIQKTVEGFEYVRTEHLPGGQAEVFYRQPNGAISTLVVAPLDERWVVSQSPLPARDKTPAPEEPDEPDEPEVPEKVWDPRTDPETPW